MNAINQSPIHLKGRTALVAGILYLVTFISIPTLSLYRSIHEPGYILRPGSDTAVVIGGILEIIVALAGIGTAVALYPVLKRKSQGLAMALVACRTLEASTMFMGVAFLLSAVALRDAGAGALITSHALVILYDRIFLLGQSFMPALDDLLLGIVLYRARLVPRFLALIGIAGSVPLIMGWVAVLFGIIAQHSVLAGLSALLVALFEFSLGIWLITRGFKSNENEKQISTVFLILYSLLINAQDTCKRIDSLIEKAVSIHRLMAPYR